MRRPLLPLVVLVSLLTACSTTAPTNVQLGRPVLGSARSGTDGALEPGRDLSEGGSGSSGRVVSGTDRLPPAAPGAVLPPVAVPPPMPVPKAPPPSVGPAPDRPGVAAAPSGELTVGAQGPAVLALEQRLDALRYDVGVLDGTFDRGTGYAVMAFQKVQGLPRTGRANDDVVAAVLGAVGTPPPLAAQGGADRVEVDLARQVLFLYRAGSLAKILPVSTGSNTRFCSEGYCRRAVTPVGAYAVYRQGVAVEKGPLGTLYRPQYFNGGIAIHGSPSVPASPASHGCVRIPMSASKWFPEQVAVGTPVFVVEGPGPVTAGSPVPAAPVVAPPPPATPAAPASLVAPIAPLLGILAPPTTTPQPAG